MRSLFYPKMAATNIRKNGKLFLPYILTGIFSVMMFFVMDSISGNKGINEMQGADSLAMMLRFGETIIGIFAALFLFYTNSFIIKRRKKELGLYSILGLEKRHIGRILFFECLYTSVIAIGLGILGGVLLSKLMFLILLKMIDTEVSFAFSFNWFSLKITLSLFGATYLCTLVSNLFATGKSNPIDLLYGGNKGEKEPKARWFLALIGAILMGIGYFMAITVQSPVDALIQLFIAILLVMGGTYLLFIAGSIALLKILKRNKHFYYKQKNFIAVSGMLYRMKQNAVGLANICILSTGVLLSIATTISLNIGMEDLIRTMYPSDCNISVSNGSDEQMDEIVNLYQRTAKDYNIKITDPLNIDIWRLSSKREGNELKIFQDGDDYQDMEASVLMDMENYQVLNNSYSELKPDEVYVEGFMKSFSEPVIKIGGQEFKVKEELKSSEIAERNYARMVDGYGIVFANSEVLESVCKQLDVFTSNVPDTAIGFNISGEKSDIEGFRKNLGELYRVMMDKDRDLSIYLQCEQTDSIDMKAMISGFLFIGVFIGVLFLMATVLIIYYKQISEGYDDKNRFEIMQKVGMGKHEVKKAIQSQVLLVFFLPLILAILHVVAAFNLMGKLLMIFGLTNIWLFAVCTAGTILIFAVIYSIVFAVTARTYYKIVG